MKTKTDYRNYTIKIVPDDSPMSPDEWGDNNLFLVYDHRDFEIKKAGFDPEDLYNEYSKGKKSFDNYWIFPVFAYIHSGVYLQLQRYFPGLPQGHNEFDVSFRGFALASKNEWKTTKKAHSVCESLIEEWNDLLTGNVYGFETVDPEGNEIDSCWGFYGDPEKSGLMEQAKDNIDCEIKKRLQEKIANVKTWIKNNVPLEKRQELLSV